MPLMILTLIINVMLRLYDLVMEHLLRVAFHNALWDTVSAQSYTQRS